MKFFIPIVLLFSLLTQNVSKLIIVINYGINKEFISKKFCVNRDKPKSCCEGKCELKKQLDEEEKKENLPSGLKDKFEKQNYYSPEVKVLASRLECAKPNFIYLNRKLSSGSKQIFHPPPFLA